MRTTIATGLMLAFAGAYVHPGDGQQVQPRPGFGSGIVTVQGKVEVTSLPPISATQLGEWRVSLDEASRLQLAPPSFARPGGQYRITWQDGSTQTFQAADVSAGTWMRVTGGNRTRWINLATAREVEVVSEGPSRGVRP
jgi:hypothetical protein